MKTFILTLMVMVMLLGMGANCLADDTGIMIIGGPEVEAEVVSLDDFKVGDVVDIEGYCEIELTNVTWNGVLLKYDKDMYFDTWSGYWEKLELYDPGDDAKYFRLRFNILNTQKEAHDFCEDFQDIVCTYDEEYQFGGWVRQNTTIKSEGRVLEHVLYPSGGGYPIGSMYRGEYSVVVTLPYDVYERVTERGKPLSVNFKLGENEITYIWRERE